jgi:hypothetical protein
MASYFAVENGARVKLPAAVSGSFEVYVNGVAQRRGVDYELEGDEIVFSRPLAQEGRLGFWRWTSIFFGIAGTYRKHEQVDIVYQGRDGRRLVATGLAPLPSNHDE